LQIPKCGSTDKNNCFHTQKDGPGLDIGNNFDRISQNLGSKSLFAAFARKESPYFCVLLLHKTPAKVASGSDAGGIRTP
jgi:hypothetical protein